MQTETNRAVVRRWIEEGWNGHATALIDTLYAPDVVQHDPSSPLPVTGRAALTQYVAGYLQAFPDLQFTTEDLLAEGDRVLWRFTAHGSHTGPLLALPPTGQRIAVSGMALFRVADGQIAEVWVNFDALGMFQTLGLIPAMA